MCGQRASSDCNTQHASCTMDNGSSLVAYGTVCRDVSVDGQRRPLLARMRHTRSEPGCCYGDQESVRRRARDAQRCQAVQGGEACAVRGGGGSATGHVTLRRSVGQPVAPARVGRCTGASRDRSDQQHRRDWGHKATVGPSYVTGASSRTRGLMNQHAGSAGICAGVAESGLETTPRSCGWRGWTDARPTRARAVCMYTS